MIDEGVVDEPSTERLTWNWGGCNVGSMLLGNVAKFNVLSPLYPMLPERAE